MARSWSIRHLQVSGEIVGAGDPVEVFPVMVDQFSFPKLPQSDLLSQKIWESPFW